MAQISVPSSDIIIFDNDDTTITPQPIWPELADPSNSNYVRFASSGINTSSGLVYLGMQSLTDPLVNTGHVFRVTVRSSVTYDDALTLGYHQWNMDLLTGDAIDGVPPVGFIVHLELLPLVGNESGFVELTHTLSEAEVIAFRDGGGYGSSTLQLYVVTEGFSADFDFSYAALEVPDSGPISWWYKASTDEYKYQPDSPGAGYVETTPPVMKAYGEENPIQGVSTGGTAIIISGDGFADGLTVTFGGVSATSIVVVNQHTITCNTPAFGGSLDETQIVDVGDGDMKSANVALATVTVTNPDGQSASM